MECHGLNMLPKDSKNSIQKRYFHKLYITITQPFYTIMRLGLHFSNDISKVALYVEVGFAVSVI